MPKSLMEPRFLPNKIKIKNKPELNDTKLNLPPNLQAIQTKITIGKWIYYMQLVFFYPINEP